jgi:hypothetical protein
MYKLLSNDVLLDDDLFYYLNDQPLKQLTLDETLNFLNNESSSHHYQQQQTKGDDDDNNNNIYTNNNIDDDLNIINIVINEVYLNDLKTKSSKIYWNSLNQENDKDKCFSQFEGLIFIFYLNLIIFCFNSNLFFRAYKIDY